MSNPPSVGEKTLPTIRVFLAEDDAEMRRLIAATLRRDGHFVLEAQDGPGLLLEIGHAYWGDLPDSTPTVVISDLRMPGRDGLTILRGLRQHQWCPPFILITGFGDKSVHEQAERLGARVVFDKPFDLDQLRAAVVRLARCGEGHVGIGRSTRGACGDPHEL